MECQKAKVEFDSVQMDTEVTATAKIRITWNMKGICATISRLPILNIAFTTTL